jgi:hypothetical protein
MSRKLHRSCIRALRLESWCNTVFCEVDWLRQRSRIGAFLTIAFALLTLSMLVFKPIRPLGAQASNGLRQPARSIHRHALCVGCKALQRAIDACQPQNCGSKTTVNFPGTARLTPSFATGRAPVTTVFCPLKIPPDTSSDLPFQHEFLLEV